MKKYKFSIFLFVLAIATVYAACRKTDQSADKPLMEGIESRFFSRHASANPLVKAITAFAKSENEKYSFVERMVKQIGYPQWDKAIIIPGARSDKAAGRNAEDSVELTYIPFVRDSQNYVNATLAVAITPADTAFRIICDWQYGDTAATGMSKKEFALTLINLDNAVFGNRMFKVLDSAIFEGKPQYLKLGAASNNRHIQLDRSSLVLYTYSYSICWTEWVPLHAGQVVGCSPGPNCPFYTAHEYCIDITWTVGGEGGSGGSGGGSGGGTGGGTGGGSGSGGGWIPPQNPNPCGIAARTQLQEGCGPGWVPIPIDDDNAPPAFNPNIYDSVRVSNEIFDSFPCIYHLIKDTLFQINRLTQIGMHDFFGVNQYNHTYYRIDWTLGCNDPDAANTKNFGTLISINGIDHWTDTIRLNPCFLNRASKEKIIGALVHETIHAYINWCLMEYRRTSPMGIGLIDSFYLKKHFPLHWDYLNQRPWNQANQHELIALNYISYIGSIVYTYYNRSAPASLRTWASRKIAAGGLTKTSAWGNAFDLTDTCNIKAVNYWSENFQNSPFLFQYSGGGPCNVTDRLFRDSLKMSSPDSCQ